MSLCGYGTVGWLAGKLKAHLPAGTDESKAAYALFTWNSIGIIDEPSMVAITHEAWFRNPTTVIKKVHHGHTQKSAASEGETIPA